MNGEKADVSRRTIVKAVWAGAVRQNSAVGLRRRYTPHDLRVSITKQIFHRSGRRIYRRARGLFLSYPLKGRLREILADLPFDNIEVICATDGERILGLGDQGAGGMGIPIGKLSLYTDCAGIDPARTMPILLDTGTDNEALLGNPLYVGWRHPRVRGAEYDAFIDEFVEGSSPSLAERDLAMGGFRRSQCSCLAGSLSRPPALFQ